MMSTGQLRTRLILTKVSSKVNYTYIHSNMSYSISKLVVNKSQ